VAEDKRILQRNFLTAGALLGMLAVIFGAMGAHALKDKLEPAQLSSFETAVRFQFFHALVFLILGNSKELIATQHAKTIFAFLITGVILFSGSIYLLSTAKLSGLNNLRFIGPITPIGGMLMITAWGLLTYCYYTIYSKK
jgi:uncharacterized membrane protein YgdD (TMEM256/DUF423 family)